MLKRVSKKVEENFYDPNLKGLDWRGLTDEARNRIEKTESELDMYIAIYALTEQLKDSHTAFIPPIRTRSYYYGFDVKAFGDEIRIYDLKKDGPAARVGLQLGDRVWTINQYAVGRHTLDLVMFYFRVLNPWPVMKIAYSRGEQAARTVVQIEAEVKQRPVLTRHITMHELILEMQSQKEEFYYNTYDDEIGFVGMPSFLPGTGFFQKLIRKIKKPRAVIIDLRGNIGGSLDSLTYVTGFFQPEPAIIAYEVSRKKREPIKAKTLNPRLPVPLYILVDSQTASAAEVFAHHFQRIGQAVVIGDRTAGRVTISRYFADKIGAGLVTHYGVQVAVSRLVFPDGEELEGRGVAPDLVCIPSQEDLNREHDPCLVMALTMARLSPPEAAGSDAARE
jgi:C-terminal peptidase prc